MTLDEQKINNQNHLTNLWKHMARTAKKYDPIRDDVDVEIFRELTEKYNKHMVHIVFDIGNDDYDEALYYAKQLANYITDNSGKELYALTVTVGAQPEGYSMMPCIHIIYNNRYLLILEDLLNKLE